MEFDTIILLAWLGTSFWVLYDASNIGAGKGTAKGLFRSMGPGGWFFSCLLGWVIALPAYLMLRDKIKADADAAMRGNALARPPLHASVPVPTSNTISDLVRLAELREKSVISEDEFQAMKGDLLREEAALLEMPPPLASQSHIPLPAPPAGPTITYSKESYVWVKIAVGLIVLVAMILLITQPVALAGLRNWWQFGS